MCQKVRKIRSVVGVPMKGLLGKTDYVLNNGSIVDFAIFSSMSF